MLLLSNLTAIVTGKILMDHCSVFHRFGVEEN